MSSVTRQQFSQRHRLSLDALIIRLAAPASTPAASALSHVIPPTWLISKSGVRPENAQHSFEITKIQSFSSSVTLNVRANSIQNMRRNSPMSDQPFGRSRRDFMRIAVTAGTTGPVSSLLLGDPALEGRLQLDGIVTTVDAKQTHPAGQGDRQFHRRIAACDIP
jgi:hypothetical protein